MSCNDDVVSNGNITCNISGNSSNIVTAISIMVKVGNNISFAKFEPSSIWQGDGDNGDIELYTAMDVLGNFDINCCREFWLVVSECKNDNPGK